MSIFTEMFGKEKVIIAMVHFPPLPGQPLYDTGRGVAGLVDVVGRDLSILARSGVDGVIFCNEGDRPYRTTAGPETTATMAAVITQLASDITVPFGVDVLWDPNAAIALAAATGAAYVREVFTGAYAGDFGVWNTDPAAALALRRRLGAEHIRLFFNVTAEFAAPIAPRDIGTAARSAVFSSLADAVCISGPVTGLSAEMDDLLIAKQTVGATPVIANTGVRTTTVGDILATVDGCIVGTALKREGVTWNEVDESRVEQLLDAAASSGHWQRTPRSSGNLAGGERAASA